MSLMEDLMNLTDQKLDDWRVRYFKSRKEKNFSREALEELIPVTPEAYDREYGKAELDNLKAIAGVEVTTKAPKRKNKINQNQNK